METQVYKVTERAGPKVAGRVVAHGTTIELTEPEARAEILAGAIELVPKTKKDAPPPSPPVAS